MSAEMICPIILVPVHLDALYVKNGRWVIQPTADFTQLPYFDGARDVNAGIAYLSEECAAQPFQDEHLHLDAGIHLHWALPDALTKATRWARSAAGATPAFPPVPDRWLVTQGRAAAGGQVVEKQWVVASNYLYDIDAPGDPRRRPNVAFPVQNASSQTSANRQPYRYLGRAWPLDEWRARGDADDAAQLSPLTAVGYGDPTFAAFYPNCHSVFGFCDTQFSDAIPKGLFYELIGWYSRQADDYLSIVLEQVARARADEGRQTLPKDKLLAMVLKEQFGWSVDAELPADGATPAIVCYARLTFQPKDDALREPQLDRPAVTLGNSAGEALAAYLAQSIGPANKPVLEEQLQAVALAIQLDGRELDIAAKFQEARHAQGFAPLDGGMLWVVRPADNKTAAEQAGDQAPWPDTGELLSALNRLQNAYDRAWDEIDALRRQLFSDWYKYLLCAHPPENAEADYPNANEVRFYIEHRSLPALQKRSAAAGELILSTAADTPPMRASPRSRPHSLAGRIERALAELRLNLNQHNATAKQPFVLQSIAAPRYWQPAEPVVLLTGPAAAASLRHSRDHLFGDGDLLQCELGAVADTDDIANHLPEIARRVGAIDPRKPGAQLGFRTWTEQPWHPFMLEWEVELRPFKHLSNHQTRTRDYAPDYVKRNFTLKRVDIDLTPRAPRPALARGAHVYSGASLLTPHIADQAIERLRDFLKADANRGAASRPQLTDETRARLQAALDQLDSGEFFCMAQSLRGFNDALLMHRQTFQLAIDDPIGFSSHREFANKLRDAVGPNIFSAPQPFDDFSPIRTGELRLLRLRLIDTFGRAMDIPCDTCSSAETMPSRPHATGAGVLLPPRLVQPARIQFRWLAADLDLHEMNGHPNATPICGWVAANHIDQSLFFYSQAGEMLGYLEVEADAVVRWRSAPGREPPIDQLGQVAPDLLNPRLRRMITFLLGATPDYFTQFLEDLEQAQALIEPERAGQHGGPPLLMGQPLALVRATIGLELQGPPAVHQGWNEFRLDMTRRQRETDSFTEVMFPLRLGEQNQLNDGLTVYWIEDADGAYLDNAYYIPYYEPDDDPSADPADKACDFLYQSVDTPPLTVTMLVDPRGVVHLTSGILPTKAIDIPPHQYGPALERMAMSFLAAPLLADRRAAGMPDEIGLPLSDPPGYAWSWIERRGREWRRGAINAKNVFTPLAAANELREGWLELTPAAPPDQASGAPDGKPPAT